MEANLTFAGLAFEEAYGPSELQNANQLHLRVARLTRWLQMGPGQIEIRLGHWLSPEHGQAAGVATGMG